MRMNRFLAGAVASVLAFGAISPAFADPDRHRGGDRREWRDDRRGHHRDDRHDRRHDRRAVRHHERHDRRAWHDDRRHHGPYRPGPPPRVVYRPAYVHGPGYGWKVGHRYRDYYRGPVYVVNDYPRYHVRRPPRGHQWVRDDRGNLLLVAIASGILADFVINGR